MPLIVGFSGHSGVGKDTCARLLAQVSSFSVGSTALAARVKSTAHSLYRHTGLESASYYEQHREARYVKLPLIGKSPVQVWIELGDAMRGIYENTWVDSAMRDAQEGHTDVVCVTDVRYPNEAETIQRAGGVVIRVVNPRAKPLDSRADHAMVGWGGRYDFEIMNDGSETELENRIHRLSKQLEKRLLLDKN